MRLPYYLPLVGLALAAGLSADVVILEEIVVKVNDGIILRSEYERTLDQDRRELLADPALTDAEREEQLSLREKSVLRDMIDQRLLVQKGEELGIEVEAQVLRQRDEIMTRNNIESTDDFEAWVLERTGEPAEDLMDRMRENFLSQAVLGQEVSRRVICHARRNRGVLRRAQGRVHALGGRPPKPDPDLARRRRGCQAQAGGGSPRARRAVCRDGAAIL